MSLSRSTVARLWVVMVGVWLLGTMVMRGRVQQEKAGGTVRKVVKDSKPVQKVAAAVESAVERVLKTETDKGMWKEDGAAEEYVTMRRVTGCDVFTVPFTPENDAKCIDYMSDIENWDEIKPLPQAFDMRTIKFKVKFVQENLHAIIKVPQRSFPVEAVSEVGAYHGDRVMEINRIPPTAWVAVPVKMFMDSVKHHGKKMKMVQQFAKEAGASSFIEWVEKDFGSYTKEKGLVMDGKVHVSVQLFIVDVRRLLDSALAIPYKAHNGSWARWLDPRHPYPVEIRPSIYHISELVTYDYVMGNSDRSPNKNNFVVGACKQPAKSCPPPHHPGHPTYVHLDNGMCFYTPQRNPINGKEWEMCIYQKKLIERLKELKGIFMSEMEDAMPENALAALGVNKVKQCEKRIPEVLKKVEKCLRKYDASTVLV